MKAVYLCLYVCACEYVETEESAGQLCRAPHEKEGKLFNESPSPSVDGGHPLVFFSSARPR